MKAIWKKLGFKQSMTAEYITMCKNMLDVIDNWAYLKQRKLECPWTLTQKISSQKENEYHDVFF